MLDEIARNGKCNPKEARRKWQAVMQMIAGLWVRVCRDHAAWLVSCQFEGQTV